MLFVKCLLNSNEYMTNYSTYSITLCVNYIILNSRTVISAGTVDPTDLKMMKCVEYMCVTAGIVPNSL